MKKEWLVIKEKETTVKVKTAKVEAVRSKDIVKKGYRVYKDGKIGISGAIGDVPMAQLEKDATENLMTDIAYPYALTGDKKDHRNYNASPMDAKTLLEETEAILAFFRESYPEFDYSEHLSVIEHSAWMQNTEGLDLKYEDAYFELALILKEIGGPNVFDGFLSYFGRSFDRAKFIEQSKAFMKGYLGKADLPEGDKLPVFFIGEDSFNGIFSRSLNGEIYATGSSLFKGKLGETLFNEKLTLSIWKNPVQNFAPFFDREGMTYENDKLPLIQNGKFVSVFADKRTSDLYSLPYTGGATGDYDGLPVLTAPSLGFDIDTEDITQVLKGQKSILVVISSGGDFTTDGDYATPVQVSFLLEGTEIIGKLPEFNMRSNLYDMFGKDYIGTFESPYYIGEGAQLHGMWMKIN